MPPSVQSPSLRHDVFTTFVSGGGDKGFLCCVIKRVLLSSNGLLPLPCRRHNLQLEVVVGLLVLTPRAPDVDLGSAHRTALLVAVNMQSRMQTFRAEKMT